MASASFSEEKAFVITWTIQNFPCCLNDFGTFLRSLPFVIDDVRWNLELYPRGRVKATSTTVKEDVICARLRRSVEDYGPKSISVSSDLCFVSANKIATSFFKQNINFKWGDFVEVIGSREELTKLSHDTVTVRCRIWKGEIFPMDTTHYVAVTKVEAERNFFEWTVKYCREGMCSIKATNENSSDQNQLSIKSSALSSSSCELVLEMTPMKNTKADIFICRIYLVDLKKPHFLLNSHEIRGTEFEGKWEFPIHLDWNELVCKKQRHFHNDALKLRGELISSYGNITSNTIRQLESDTLKHCPCEENEETKLTNESFLHALWSMYEEGSLCDVALKTPTKKFPAHSVVLSARSPVFKSMLSTNMLEKVSESIEVPDLENDVVQALLFYAYTGKVVKLDWKFALKFYYCADKYELLSLRKEISTYLLSGLTTRNMCDVLLLAEMHQDSNLKCDVENFIDLFKEEVFASEEWKKFECEKPAIAFQIFHEMFSQ